MSYHKRSVCWCFCLLRDKQKYFFCFDRKELNEKKKSNYWLWSGDWWQSCDYACTEITGDRSDRNHHCVRKFTGGDGIWKCKENPEADEPSGCSRIHWGKHSLKAGLRECSGYSRRRRAWRKLSAWSNRLSAADQCCGFSCWCAEKRESIHNRTGTYDQSCQTDPEG